MTNKLIDNAMFLFDFIYLLNSTQNYYLNKYFQIFLSLYIKLNSLTAFQKIYQFLAQAVRNKNPN